MLQTSYPAIPNPISPSPFSLVELANQMDPTIQPGSLSQSTSTHHMTTRTRDHTHKPRHFPDYVAFFLTIEISSLQDEPTTFAAANKYFHWHEAMA